MKSINDFLEKTMDQRIYQKLLNANQSHKLTECLVAMQTERGIDAAQAQKNAGLCIAAVAQWESIHDRVCEDAGEVGDLLLDSLKDKGEAERTLILHKLYFGLTESSQEEEDAALNERFWRYYVSQENQKDALSNAELEEKICQELNHYRLSPGIIRAMARKMESTGDHLAAAAALSQNGYSFKCLVAMELYLNGDEPVSIPEAVNTACTGVEAQAVADAVGKGFLSRDTAKRLLIAAAITAAIVGIALIAFGLGGGVAVQNTAAALASAEPSGIMIALPEVFAEFATGYTAAGEPATLLHWTDTMGGAIEAQRKAALAKKTVGAVVLASSAAIAALSDKTADLAGKISTGFASMRRGNPAISAEGLRSLEYDRELWEASQEAHTGQEKLDEEALDEEEQALNSQVLLY